MTISEFAIILEFAFGLWIVLHSLPELISVNPIPKALAVKVILAIVVIILAFLRISIIR